MSYRTHNLRQSHTFDIPTTNAINRNPSTTSSASSGYSYSSEHSANSQYTSASSTHGSPSTHHHKRGQSDVVAKARGIFESGEMKPSSKVQDNLYGSVRQSLRPLPQAPASPPKPTASPSHLSKKHERHQTVDIGRLSLSYNDGLTSHTPVSRPLPSRPNSLLLVRPDSIREEVAVSQDLIPHAVHSTHIGAPELEMLGKSSTSQFRTLSRLAQSGDAKDFNITSPDQEVAGLRGRRRLQRTDKTASRKNNGFGWERNWMDKQRQFLQAYEYLCHVGEAKEWIEDVIQQPLPPIVELEEALRDGVRLAEVVESLNPEKRFRIFRHPKLQYRHSDNIAIFFRYLDQVEVPDLFRFELIDLYEKKNIPKVIYCIHALSWLLFRKGIVDFQIGNLVGQLEFEHHELEAMQKGLDMLGTNMPSFGNMGADFGVPQPEPEPEETEEERIDRELTEQEGVIVDFQAQIRGAMSRLQLGLMMQQFWDNENWVIDLQSRIRGDFTRQIMNYRLQTKKSNILFQSAARGFLARRKLEQGDRFWKTMEPKVLALQSLIRAKKVRDEVQNVKSRMARCEGPIRNVQAVFKGFLIRKSQVAQQQETKESSGKVHMLQALVRGMLVRNQVTEDLQALDSQVKAIVMLQSAARASMARTQIAREQEKLHASTKTWASLQSVIRGYNTRLQQEALRAELGQHATKVELLQAVIRGRTARAQQEALMMELGQHESVVELLQATIRGRSARAQQTALLVELGRHEPTIELLQAAIRGCSARAQQTALKTELVQHEHMVELLQAAIRGSSARAQQTALLEELGQHEPTIELLQATIRGCSARAQHTALKAELDQHATIIEQLQAMMRAVAVRREIGLQLEALSENEPEVIELQSRIRGMFERRRVFAIQQYLDRQEPVITSLQARIRGYVSRMQYYSLCDELESHNHATAEFQAILKAMMTRARVDDLLTELAEEEGTIVDLQAAARAFMVRARFLEKKRFYEENMKKVIKIQSFVRAKVQGEAYKSLTTGKNPPVSAVKNFVHLLNDSDFDFNEEVEFERMRKTVVHQVQQNEMVEQYIDQLDIKIALLVKNKITLDEVVRHQHTFGGHTVGLLANSAIASSNSFDLKALNKSSRKKLESYQQLFFSLQTQPQYLARLFKHIRENGTVEKESKRVELLMMSLFGYAQKRREEYYLLKLISRSIREEIDCAVNMQEYSRGHYFWSKLLSNYTRSPRDRKYLRSLLGPLIRDTIVDDPDLDLESDPMQIYKASINNEELRTGRPDHRPLDVPREVAIRDPETRRLFIDHLRDLREICDQLFLSLEDQVHKMPYGLRFVCNQMFEALCQRFDREPQENCLQIVSHWLWKFYLQPAVIGPENFGVIDKALSPLQKRNLGEVSKVIGQIALGRPFGGENIYLQPLNAFISESIDRLRQITNDLISVPDAEKTFDIDEYNDLYAKNKPTLYIKMADVFSIHSLVAAQLMVMSLVREDVLRDIMQDLGSAKSNENEMSAAGSADIQMFLTPRIHNIDDPEAEVKSLFMETKRCVLYIIRVQTGANLLEILVKPITPEDEAKWEALLREDFAGNAQTRGAYSDDKMVDLTSMSYHDLKRTALENVLQLERLGRISKSNHYQDVLNAIASDIRTQSRRRVQRQRELEGVRSTLSNLHEKAKYLEQQRKSYDDYIEQAMKTLQNKKGRKRFLLPFTRQYNHQRELERRGQVPKFGSFKYSARQLSEKGVLVTWNGMTEKEWEKINLTISCDQVGVFAIEGTRGSIQIPGALAQVPIEDLLQAQFEAHQFMTLFEGNIKLNVNLLLHLVYKKFYRTQ
ncbi:Ras GTPase-activating-like protein rng2 [Cladobotryum mycophilum]|uniref:Ras GTPase-activating-like protein rng2 n=1 Tax=Cladobotryum mycophilum TaxID=491253 RepID=A0ABR0SMD9_9HYPO